MTKRTILQVVPRLEAGGSEQSAIEIAEALVQADARALVATEGGRMATALEQAGGEILPMPVASKNPLVIFANARRLARAVDEHKIDLLHARSRAPGWSAFLAARRMRRPFVTTYHGSYASPGPFKNWYNSIMARGDLVIANSQFTAKLIAARHKLPRERIRVIYRGVDTSRFSPDQVSANRMGRLRALWGVGRDQPVVIQAARLTSWKGQPLVIEAAHRLLRENRLGDAVIVMAGDAQGRVAYQKELEKLIRRRGLMDRIKLVGHCDDMPAAFALAQVAVIASTSAETFGRTSIEAQAMGCPVIVSDIGAVPETVVAEGRQFTGWVIPPNDAKAIAEQIAVALALAPEERAAIGARARRNVAAKFTLMRMQRATLAVYDELLTTHFANRFEAYRTPFPL